MMLDISIGAIFAAVIPDTLRSRVTGAFQAANYGTRPLGALLGGLLGASLGLRPALRVATLGGGAGLTARQCATVLSQAGHQVEALSAGGLCLCRAWAELGTSDMTRSGYSSRAPRSAGTSTE
jgi:hypothetical protein